MRLFAIARKKQEYRHGALENKKLRSGSHFFTKDSKAKLYFGKMHIFTIFRHNESSRIITIPPDDDEFEELETMEQIRRDLFLIVTYFELHEKYLHLKAD